MTINAITTNGELVNVEINADDDRHIVIDGEEVDINQKQDPDTEKAIAKELDGLYDMPIYEDGIIHTGKYKRIWAWQKVSVIDGK